MSVAPRVADQLCASAVTFLATSIGAALMSTAEFGLLAIASSLILIYQAIARAFYAEVLAVARVEMADRWLNYRRWARTQLLYVQVATVALGSVSFLVLGSSPIAGLILASSLSAALLPAFDLNRSTLLLQRRAGTSALALGLGLVTQLSLVVVGVRFSAVGPAVLIGAWAIGLLITTSVTEVALRRSGVREKLGAFQFRYARVFVTESLLSVGASQGGVALAGIVSSVGASAGLRGAVLLMFPVNMVTQAISPTIVADVSRRMSSRAGLRSLYLLSSVLLVSVLVYAFLISQANVVLTVALRDTRAEALSALPGVSLSIAAGLAYLVPWAAARASGRAKYGLLVRMATAPIAFALPAIATAVWPSFGAALSQAVVGAVYMVATIVIFALLSSRFRKKG